MDLFEVTKVVCIAFISGTFTMAFPLLLQSISRIDEKYKSSILTQRFKSEKIFCRFKCVLYLSLFYVFYHFFVARLFPWTHDWGEKWNCIMENSSSIILAICTIALILKLILLIQRIMIYYDHSLLLKKALETFKGFDNMNNREYDAFLFILYYNIYFKDDFSGKDAETLYNFLSKYTQDIYELTSKNKSSIL